MLESDSNFGGATVPGSKIDYLQFFSTSLSRE